MYRTTTAPHPAATEDADVLVVGAGPTGLTAAGDLARAGRSVVLLERWPQPNPSSKAFATMPRTKELLDARGLLADLEPLGVTAEQVRLFGRTRLDLMGVRSRFPGALITPQTNVDAALERYATEQGATILRGLEVTGLTQGAGSVAVTARPKDDADPAHVRRFRARYLVAADGAHSTVRELLGVDFPGEAVMRSVILADVKLTDGPAGRGLTLGSTPDELAFLVAYGRSDAGGAWFRAMAWDRDHQVGDDVPVEQDELEGILRRAFGRDLGVADLAWVARFHADERQVAEYRHGRVFLAGDAAHVHSPVGGQGMNTGIQDAANLAWKLDAVLGGADEAILDSYQAERHPIGRLVIRQSGLMLRAVTLHPRPTRLVRDLVAPLLLRIPAARRRIAGRFTGTELRYASGRGEHRLVGTRATEVPLDGAPLTELQRDAGFVLVLGRHDEAPATDGAPVTRRTDAGPALLVRPDGYVAWAGSLTDDDGWRTTLERWLGEAAATTSDRAAARVRV